MWQIFYSCLHSFTTWTHIDLTENFAKKEGFGWSCHLTSVQNESMIKQVSTEESEQNHSPKILPNPQSLILEGSGRSSFLKSLGCEPSLHFAGSDLNKSLNTLCRDHLWGKRQQMSKRININIIIYQTELSFTFRQLWK